MRQIEKEMNNAVRNKIAWSKGNSCTTFDNTIENCFVYLHGNHIATLCKISMDLRIFDGGWRSNTTKSRLNALLEEFGGGDKVVQKNWAWFLVSNLDNSKRAFFSGMTV